MEIIVRIGSQNTSFWLLSLLRCSDLPLKMHYEDQKRENRVIRFWPVWKHSYFAGHRHSAKFC